MGGGEGHRARGAAAAGAVCESGGGYPPPPPPPATIITPGPAPPPPPALPRYLWSEVYSADMWETFKANPLDQAAGLRYRTHILAHGGAKDAAVYLREFLGREPSTAAFLRSKGLPGRA